MFTRRSAFFLILVTSGLSFSVLETKPAAWETLRVPGAWEDVSGGRHAKLDGYAWYRCYVKIPAHWKNLDLDLILRQIDDVDETFFNGEKVGGRGVFPPKYQSEVKDRRYKIPARLAKAGEYNLLAVRVYDGGEKGGIVGGTPLLRAGKEAMRLDGDWQFRVGDDVSWAQPKADEGEAYAKSVKQPAGFRGVEDYFPLAMREDKLIDALEGTKGLDEVLKIKLAKLAGGDPLAPAESMKRMQFAKDLAVDLVASEPDIRQPLNLQFDERGRLWVVQYLQYPFPAGLKIVSYDQYIRAKFDKVPPPPPNHFKGADRITILEDADGDGVYEKKKDFVDGLNIATSVLHGRGGVWILNPPYLLFYPDKDGDDVPDGPPTVHLSGFGLEDTHAVASSLMWGPDGWIYGAHGSTCTAKVKVEIRNDPKTTDFLGQAIWRYHPEKHLFEIFAEGGGNTFGVAFDDEGRNFSGTNWGVRGLHYAQGGYYIKGWGKHGPLTNPYAFGFFQHMTHTGNAERLTHTFQIYNGTTLPERFHGKILGPSPLQKRVHVAKLEPTQSTYKTTEEPFMLTTTDGWFRPVDLKQGPDGAIYIADLYENRIDHVDPRDTWDRKTGRIYRLRAKDAKPQAPVNLAKKTSAELVELLASEDGWQRRTALRLLGDRKDKSVLAKLRKLLRGNEGQLALEALWALHQTSGLEEADILAGLAHKNASVRRWTVRVVGDDKASSLTVAGQLAALASTEPDSQVRSQLASSAKRLPGSSGLPMVRALLLRNEDTKDPHIPMLLWWAIEAHAGTDRAGVLALFEKPELWKRPIVDEVILERLMQRLALAGGKEDLRACARLLELAPEPKQFDRLLAGLEASLAGGATNKLPDDLKAVIAKNWSGGIAGARLALGVRVGLDEAVQAALAIARDPKTEAKKRLDFIRLFGEAEEPRAIPVLLALARDAGGLELRQTAWTSLQRYDDPRVSAQALDLLGDAKTASEMKATLLSVLSSRQSWALNLLKAVDAGKVNPRGVPIDIVRKLRQHTGKEMATLVSKHWGKVRETTAEEKLKEMERLAGLLKASKGDEKAGRFVFTNTCGKCHKMFNEGGQVGPELTGYERDNLGFWLENVVDPSAAIRDEYTNFQVNTTDGRQLSGIIVEQNKQSVTLRSADGQTVRLARERIDDLSASPVSIMPDDQLKAMDDKQIRDLFAFLRAKNNPR